ncbi:SCO2322 family protein [Nonomuraea sp. NPDC050663]|uniref:SCO2322 family protein n=1 Tax=Nonomuraea sp. NPDC050663 TaxID=3364370 RepID=UPI0037B2D8F0
MLRAFRVATFSAVTTSLVTALTLSSPALADPNAPRSWSFWQSDGTAWLSASSAESPPEGSVIGWRFSAGADTEPPGGEVPDFATVCGKQAAAPAGSKRVVIAVDFGDAEVDAHPGEQPPTQGVLTCATGSADATALQLLATAAKARVDGSQQVVAVNGYPARAQGTDLAAPAAAAGEQSTAAASDGLPWGWILGGAGAVVLVAGGAILATRRRTPARH